MKMQKYEKIAAFLCSAALAVSAVQAAGSFGSAAAGSTSLNRHIRVLGAYAVEDFCQPTVVVDEQMALLKSKYGVSNVSYAIKVGDKIITGDSGKFKLTEISSFSETMDTQMGGLSVISQIISIILMIIIVGVISIIMNFLIESIIKKERQAMGIEKACGYTSKDIRKQIVVRMMPVAVPAIIAGTILALPVVMLFLKMAFGTVFDIRLFWVPIVIVLITLYVYVTTYISAGKVKKISVTELMTE